MACSCEAGEVGHRGTGYETGFRLWGQTEQVHDPASAHLLQGRPNRGRNLQTRVLIPGRGEDVGGQRGRKRASDNESEESTSGACDSGWGADCVELL